MPLMAKEYGLGAFVTWRGDIDRRMHQTRQSLAKFRGDMANTLRGVKSGTMGISTSLNRMNTGIRGTMGMGMGSAAMLMPYKTITSAAMESEDNLAKVKSALVATMDFAEADRGLVRLRKRIFEIGHDSRISLADLEKASYDLVSADLTLDEAMGALKPTADLAVAGQGTMQESVETMTTLLNTYGKRWGDTLTPQEKAIRIGNTLAGTIAIYKSTLPTLSEALTYVGGSANALGVDLTELAGTLGAAQTAGLKGTVAGTSLNAFYRMATRLVGQSGEAQDAATMSLEDYVDALDRGATAQAKVSLAGLKLTDAQGRLLPIYDILGQLEKRFGITSEKMDDLAKKGVKGADALEQLGIPAEYLAALQERGGGFGEEGSRIITVLLGQSEALKARISQLRESNNLDAMTAAQQESLAARYQITKNRMRELLVTVGDANLGEQKGTLASFDRILEDITAIAEAHPEMTRAGSNVLLIGGALTGLGVALNALTWASAPLLGIAKALAAIAGTPAAALAGVGASLAANVVEVNKLIGLQERAAQGDLEARSEIIARRETQSAMAQSQFAIGGGGMGISMQALNVIRQGLSLLLSDIPDKWDKVSTDLDAMWGIAEPAVDRIPFTAAYTNQPTLFPDISSLIQSGQINATQRAATDLGFMPVPTTEPQTVHHHNEQISIENRFEVTKDVDAEDLRRMLEESQADARRVAEGRRH
jgi:TP901 family phage tail tape measure protein